MTATHTPSSLPRSAMPAALGEARTSVAAAGLPSGAGGIAPRRRLSSQALLGNEREIEIEHGGQLYRLRLTSLGKLILTK